MSSQRKVVRKSTSTRVRHGRDDHVCSGLTSSSSSTPSGSSFKACGHSLAGAAATACGPPSDGKPLDLTQLSAEQRLKLESFLKSSGFGPLPKAGQTLDAATMRKLAQHMRAAAAMPGKSAMRTFGDSGEKNPKDGLVRQAVTSSKRDDVKNLLEEGGDVDEVEPKTLCTPLMLAVRDGSKEIVQLLLDYDADVTRRDKDGKTAIMEACAGGRDDLVQLLIDHGSCVADTDNNNWNSLTHAAAKGHVRCAQVVMRHLKYDKESQDKLREAVRKEEKKLKKAKDKGKLGMDLDEFEENDFVAESALAIAAENGQFEFVKWYLNHKDQFKVNDAEVQVACSKACHSKRIDLLRLLIEEHGAKVNPDSPVGVAETPLCAAAASGDLEIVKYLLHRGARVNDSDGTGFTPLMRACNEGNANLVPVFLQTGANVNAQNSQYDNWTPLCYAISQGHMDIVKLLVSAHANVNLGGTPPLLLAISLSNVEAVEYLLSHGANATQKSSHGDTALIFAADVGKFEWVQKFRQLGCEVDCVGDKGMTPLMKAAKKGSLEIVEYLLDNGAMINRTSANNECTALSLACSKGCDKIIECLLEKGANRHTRLKDNVTPLLEAIKSGKDAAANLVLYHQPKNKDYQMTNSQQAPAAQGQGELSVSGATKKPGQSKKEFYTNYTMHTPCTNCENAHCTGGMPQLSSDDDDEDEDDEEGDDGDDEQFCGEEEEEEDEEHECESGEDEEEIGEEDEEDFTSESEPSGDDAEKGDSMLADLPEIFPGDLADLDCPSPDNEYGDMKEGLDADIDFIRTQLAHFQPQSFEFRILNAMLRKAEQLQKSLPDHTPEELRRRFSEEINRWQHELQSNSNVDDLMNKLVPEPVAGREGGSKATLEEIAQFFNANPSGVLEYPSVFLDRGDFSSADSPPSSSDSDKTGVTLSADGKYIIMTNSTTSFSTPLADLDILTKIAQVADVETATITGTVQNLSLPEELAKAMMATKQNGIFDLGSFSSFLQNAKEDPQFLEDYRNATRVPASFNFASQPPASLAPTQRLIDKARKLSEKKAALSGEPLLEPRRLAKDKVPRTPEPTPDDTSEGGSDDTQFISEVKTGTFKASIGRSAKKTVRNTRDVATSVSSAVPPPKRPALVDVDQMQESDSSTPIIQAAIRGNSNMIRMLCEAGAKPNHKDKKGWTALGYAVERGHKEVVKELCEHGADIDTVMDTNQAKRDSSLTIACYNGRTEIVRTLLDYKANIEHRNSNDYTPLCVACLNGHVRVAQMLIQRGADINAR